MCLLVDSGIDPAEWAAKLEDRFYNNHAFKTTGVLTQSHCHTIPITYFLCCLILFIMTPLFCFSFSQQPSPEKEPSAKMTISK